MSDFARIATKLTSTVWAMTPESLGVILRIAESHMAGEKFEPSAEQKHYFESRATRFGGNGDGDRLYQVKNGVGILPIAGPIFGKANLLTEMSGATSLEATQQVFRMMMQDEDVHTVLMEVDSPGGSTDLLDEFAKEIFDARGTKPVFSIANTAANSAAYYLASQADRMYVTPSGQVGSIGTYIVHEDQSQSDLQAGKKFTYISAGPNKTDMNPHEPLGFEAKEHMQAFVNEHYGNFLTAVARGRGTTTETVEQNMGGGRVLSPRMALQAGAVDGILPFDALVSQLAKGPARPVTVNVGGQKVAAMIQGSQVYALENRFDSMTLPDGSDAKDASVILASWLIADLDQRAEHKDMEHSEPGTGSPPEPRTHERGDDDVAIKEGWRRNPLPVDVTDPSIEGVNPKPVNHNANTEGGEKKVDLTQEQFESLCNALGVQPSQFHAEALKAFGEVTALRAAGANASEEELVRQNHPEFYARWQEDQKTTRDAGTKSFVDSIKMFSRAEGQEMVESGLGLSALAIQTVSDSHLKFQMGTATTEDFEAAVKAITNGGIVDYTEKGSSRTNNNEDTPEWNTTSAQGLANARKIFATKLAALRAENEGMDMQAAITEMGKQEPELFRAYKMTKPEEATAPAAV